MREGSQSHERSPNRESLPDRREKRKNSGRNRSVWVMLAMRTGSRKVRAHESSEIVAGTRTHRDPLSAVPPELQLKYQDSGITVTNWDRFRMNQNPTIYSNRIKRPRQTPKTAVAPVVLPPVAP